MPDLANKTTSPGVDAGWVSEPRISNHPLEEGFFHYGWQSMIRAAQVADQEVNKTLLERWL